MFRVGEQCWKQFPHSSVVFDEGGVFCIRVPSPCPSHWSPCYDFILQHATIISVWEKGSEEAAKRMSLILLAPLIQWGVPSFLMFWVDAKSHKEHQRIDHLMLWKKRNSPDTAASTGLHTRTMLSMFVSCQSGETDAAWLHHCAQNRKNSQEDAPSKQCGNELF